MSFKGLKSRCTVPLSRANSDPVGSRTFLDPDQILFPDPNPVKMKELLKKYDFNFYFWMQGRPRFNLVKHFKDFFTIGRIQIRLDPEAMVTLC